MQSVVETVILYIVLLGLAGGMFYLNRRARQGKEVPWKFLAFLTRGTPQMAAPSPQNQGTKANQALVDEVSAVLDDIYEDFQAGQARLQEQIRILKTERITDLSRVEENLSGLQRQLETLGQRMEAIENRIAQGERPVKADTGQKAKAKSAKAPAKPRTRTTKGTIKEIEQKLHEGAGTPASESPVPAPSSAVTPDTPSSVDMRHVEILEFLLQGMEPAEISKRLAIGLQEVELVQQLTIPKPEAESLN